MSKATITGEDENYLYLADVSIDDGITEEEAVYCADATKEITGSVGIIEIAGNRSNGIVIQPGYEGNAVYNAARDGQLYQVPQKDGTQPASGNFWNWSMRPGWQKWRHPYRYATISALDGDNCTVTFAACYATDTPDGKQLDCNQVASMGATIEYMSCNGAAFTDGDEVIVELTHDANAVWSSAKVIGFKSEPKGCEWSETWEDGICGQHKWYTNNGSCVEIETYAYVSGDMLHIATKGGSIAVYYSSDDDNDLPPPIVGFLRILIPEASAGNYSGIYITAGGTKIYLKCAGSDPYPYFPTTDIGFSSEEMEIDLSTCGLNVGDTITDIRISASGRNLTWPAYQASTITIDYMIFSAVSLYE